MSQAKLLEFESCLREAARLLKDSEVVITAMLITGDYSHLGEVESIVRKALERIQEARRLARELVEEADKAIPWELVEEAG